MRAASLSLWRPETFGQRRNSVESSSEVCLKVERVTEKIEIWNGMKKEGSTG